MVTRTYARRVDPFDELADESRAADAVRRRSQARWLRQQAAEEATLVGVLVDLAERGDVVSLRSASGRTHRGPVSFVGGDHVVIGDDVWVRVAAVVAVRFAGDVATGDRAAVRHTRLVESLAEMVPDRPAVVVVTFDGTSMRGELIAAGAEIVSLVLDGDRSQRCVIAVDGIAEVIVAGRLLMGRSSHSTLRSRSRAR
jgi:hypothetical protein